MPFFRWRKLIRIENGINLLFQLSVSSFPQQDNNKNLLEHSHNRKKAILLKNRTQSQEILIWVGLLKCHLEKIQIKSRTLMKTNFNRLHYFIRIIMEKRFVLLVLSWILLTDNSVKSATLSYDPSKLKSIHINNLQTILMLSYLL